MLETLVIPFVAVPGPPCTARLACRNSRQIATGFPCLAAGRKTLSLHRPGIVYHKD
jgi:hypothetical protein